MPGGGGEENRIQMPKWVGSKYKPNAGVRGVVTFSNDAQRLLKIPNDVWEMTLQ